MYSAITFIRSADLKMFRDACVNTPRQTASFQRTVKAVAALFVGIGRVVAPRRNEISFRLDRGFHPTPAPHNSSYVFNHLRVAAEVNLRILRS